MAKQCLVFGCPLVSLFLDHALLRFFVHTGCRLSAATELLTEDVWQGGYNDGACLIEGTVLEKFHQKKKFVIDHILADALARQIRDRWPVKTTTEGSQMAQRTTSPDRYVFPSFKKPNRRICRSTISKWLNKLSGDFCG